MERKFETADIPNYKLSLIQSFLRATADLQTYPFLWDQPLGPHRCVAVHAVEIDGRQTLIRQTVVKAASRTVAPFLVCVVQRHLKDRCARQLLPADNTITDTNAICTFTNATASLSG